MPAGAFSPREKQFARRSVTRILRELPDAGGVAAITSPRRGIFFSLCHANPGRKIHEAASSSAAARFRDRRVFIWIAFCTRSRCLALYVAGLTPPFGFPYFATVSLAFEMPRRFQVSAEFWAESGLSCFECFFRDCVSVGSVVGVVGLFVWEV